MTVRREIAQNAFLLKRISYLACDDTNTLIPPCASRTTSDEERRSSVFASNDNAGKPYVLNRGERGFPDTRAEALAAMTGCGKNMWVRQNVDGSHVWGKPGLSGYLVCLVYLVSLMQPNKPDKPNRPNEQDRLADFFGILLDHGIVTNAIQREYYGRACLRSCEVGPAAWDRRHEITRPRSLSDIDLSTTANDGRASAMFSVPKNSHRIPANTPPVFRRARSRICLSLPRLVTSSNAG